MLPDMRAQELPPLPEGGVLPPKASGKQLRIQPNAGNPKEVVPVPEQFRKPALVYSPELALKTFTVPDGFHVDLVAAEPMVESPVALSFAPRGGLYVVEMRGYMQDLGGNGEDLQVGRIKRLESSKNDGVYDRVTVFVDALVMPRAVMSFGDGVLACVPPNLIYYRDTNGDGVADENTIIDDKVGQLGGQPEHMPNTPMWALDNWIYLSQHGTRYRFSDGKWIKDSVAARGQWGQSMDDEGRLFGNLNGSPLNVNYFPPSHYARNPRFESPEGLFVPIMKDRMVWPTASSRGFQTGFRESQVRKENSTLISVTAACGPCIYRGDLFPPDFRGNAFACEPAGNLVKRMILSEENGLLSAANAYEQRDFFTSTDERFRPVNLNVGPEGALYVTDMYRGIIQHAYFMTPFLADYIRIRQLEQPIDHGRIWRIVPNGTKPHRVVLPSQPAELVPYLSHSNGWVRDNAQRMLVCAGDQSVKAALRELLLKNEQPLARLHAFWTLEGLGEFTIAKNPGAFEALRAFFTDTDPRLRAAAVRLSDMSMAPELAKLATDSDAKVRGEVAFRLASLPGEEIQRALVSLAIMKPHAFVSDALICGYAGRESDIIAALLAHPQLPGNEVKIETLIKNLARCVMAQKRPGQVALLLDLAAKQKFRTPLSKAFLSGIAPDLVRLRREPPQRFILLNEEPVLLGLLDADPNKTLKETSEGLRLMLAWPGKPGFKPPPPTPALTPQQQQLFTQGGQLYTAICAGCHQASGFGVEGLAPPLVDSEWVMGAPDRIVRILLHGVTGPIRVNNRTFSLEMPPLGAALDDKSFAAVLTYIRREWEHTASAVSPAQVAAIRERFGNRIAPWTEGELLKPSGPAPAPAAPVKTGAAPAQNPADSEQAKIVLQHVRFDPAFEFTTFAAPPMVNSPVFVSAAPDGTLFVSSDPNGSVGTTRGLGKIVRLRDTNSDGIADEAIEVAKVDAPRGLVAHGDTVFVLHPPHISAFIDRNGDGVSDEEKVIVKNVGWGYADRRADHASNGLELGIDGWLYAAIGDFGFMKAEGTDGRTLQLRGGGVVRVRPDGTGLEIYSAGTRNILEAAISPLLDGFARDNTNDGGGWNTRFHHFSGLEDHGYPRLYKNFADEAVKPLADYGGGSGCGAAWVSEPGWPDAWNHRPFTVDWGRQYIAAHSVRQSGATFVETAAPVNLAMLKPELKPEQIRNNAFRPSDVDVDARGYLYLASWVNGGFGAGDKCGVIFKMHPKGHIAPKLPDFAKATTVELAGLMTSPSHRTRLEAQRVLLRRGADDAALRMLEKIAGDKGAQLESRVAALFTLRQAAGEKAFPFIAQLAADSSIAAWAIRALADDERLAARVPTEPILAGLKSSDARTRREAVFAIARLGQPKLGTSIAPLLDDSDEVVAHTAFRALAKLRASDACFAVLDDKSASPAKRTGAIRAVQTLHEAGVVDGLIARVAKEANAERRRDLLSALCRLYNTEGEWAGDSWGTRPDDRGPYYQPEPWNESQKIADAILKTMSTLDSADATWLGNELARNRANLKDATRQLLALAEKDASVLPPLFRNLADGDDIPLPAIPLLIRSAIAKDTDPKLRTDAIIALSKTDSREAFAAIIEGMTQKCDDGIHRARRAYHAAPHLENHHELFIATANSDKPVARIAEEAVMLLASRVIGAPEARAAALAAIEENWKQGPKRQAMMIVAARETKAAPAARLIAPLLTGGDKNLAYLADTYFKTARIDPKKVTEVTPPDQLVGALPQERVLADVVKIKGDPRRGEQLFTQQGCIACHTTKAEEKQKGPYLGTIAATYKRRELAEAIIEPSKTIAQGFAANIFTMKDGEEHTGFVVREAAGSVTLRNLAAQEFTLIKTDIAKREVKEGVSLMPPGLAANLSVADFAALLSYLEELNVKNSSSGH